MKTYIYILKIYMYSIHEIFKDIYNLKKNTFQS